MPMPFNLPDRNFFLVKCHGGSDGELQRIAAANQIVDMTYNLIEIQYTYIMDNGTTSGNNTINVVHYFLAEILKHLKTHIDNGVVFNGFSSHEDYACELYNGKSICHISCSCGQELPVVYGEQLNVYDYTFTDFLSRINWAFKYIIDHSAKVQNRKFDVKPLSKEEKEVFKKMADNPIYCLEVE